MKCIYFHILTLKRTRQNPFKDECFQIAAVNAKGDTFYQDIIPTGDIPPRVTQMTTITKDKKTNQLRLGQGEAVIRNAANPKKGLARFLRFLRKPGKEDGSDRDAPVVLVGHSPSLYAAYVLVGCLIKESVPVSEGLIRGFLDAKTMIASHAYPLGCTESQGDKLLRLEYLSSVYIESRRSYLWSTLELAVNIKKILKTCRTRLGESRGTYFTRGKLLKYGKVFEECQEYL